MKLTTGILAITLMTGGVGAWAQNPDAIDNARSIAKSLQQKQANDSNAALDAAGVGQPAKPAPGAPAPAVKPAVIPGAQSAAKPVAASTKPGPAAKAQAASQSSADPQASNSHNRLQHVTVVPGADNIQIELSSSETVTPRVSKLSSPARILVELPGTLAETPQNHIQIGNAGVKGVRIGMDGKTPPTTSVVIDLDKSCAFELTPGAAGKLVLTLHTQGEVVATAKATAAVPAKTAATAAKTQVQTAAMAGASQAKLVTETTAKAKLSSAKSSGASTESAKSPVSAKPVKVAAVNAAAPKAASAPAAASAKASAPAAIATPLDNPIADAKQQPKPEDKKWAMNGKRDPFFSPVVQQASGSGCSTGKKCLEIGNINLRGVVKSDSGFIAVVTNNLNKAYFLRENDPVFNGYVVKITGDSVVFQETVEDKLGKPFTREVVKRIFTPAV